MSTTTNKKSKKGMIVNVQPLRTAEEIKSFREAIEVSSSKQFKKRNLFLFNFGINTGLRISDIIKLRVKDVKGKNDIIVREGKTSKARKIRLTEIKPFIDDYIKDITHSEWLFPSRTGDKPISVTQAYRILAKAAEYDNERQDIGTHTLRKTYGYHYYKRTKNVAALMEIFNHDSQETTKRYIGITDDEIAESLEGFLL